MQRIGVGFINKCVIGIYVILFLICGIADAKELKFIEDNSYVCMVNDAYMGKPQIPIPVEGKQYYGCCMGCVNTLNTKMESRYSVDPVSHNRVDKATAVIGRDGDDKVVYFESKRTFKEFNQITQ